MKHLDRIKKYFKPHTDRIVFITLETHLTAQKKDIEFLKNVPLPISIDYISKNVNQEELNELPFEAFVDGMINILGIDQEFKYKEQYKQFLLLSNEKIVDFILYKGLKHADEERYYDAIIHFRAALLIEQQNLSALYNYGKGCKDIFDLSKDLDEKKAFKLEAIETFEQITEIYPDFSSSYYFLGFFYTNQKVFEKARITWEKFLSLSEDAEKSEEIMVQLKQLEDYVSYEKGYNHILNEKYDKGLEILLSLEDKHSQWWNLLFFIGLAYRNTDRIEEAITYYKKVLLIKPSQIDTMNELGLCYTAISDYQNAEKYFKKALLLKDDDHEILSNLAVVYMNIGEYEKAKMCLEKASDIDPNDGIVLQWLQKLSEICNKNN